MSESDSTKIYNDYVRANLPNGMSYDTGTDRYDINNHSFFKFKNSNWYYNYISKYGYSAVSAYAVNGFEPALVFDFKGNYFRKVATDSTFPASITHTASTNATMVDSDGLLKWRPHNNLTKSNTFSTWNKNSTTVVDNAVVGPTGIANTASTVNFSSTTSNIYNLSTVAVIAGDKVTLAAWVRSDTITSLTFALNGRTKPANNTPETNLAVTSAWTLVTFEATVVANDTGLWFMIGKWNPASPAAQIGILEIYGAHMYRSDLGGMVNNSEQPTGFRTYVPTTSAAVYMPRVGHHIYDGYEWVNEGILHESEARTNLVTYSEQFDNAAWSKVNSSLSANVTTAPDGTTTADKLIADTSLSQHRLDQTPTSVAGDQTFSVYVKDAGYGFTWLRIGTSGARFSIADGTITSLSGGVTASSQDVGNGWRFMSISRSASVNDIVRINALAIQDGSDFVGDGTSGILIWGAQLEAGSTPSSYIPTAGATATRAAETLTVPAANMPYDNTNMSIQMDGKMTYADGGSYADGAFFNWSSGPDDFITYGAGGYTTDSGKVAFVQREAGVQDVVFSSNGVIAEGVFSPFNLSSRHGSTFINGAVDGTALTADLTPTALPDLSAANFQIGTIFNGTISKLRVWGEDIGDTGIATATAPTFTDEFAMTVTTTTANETFTIPCRNAGTFNAGIQWGDGSVSTVTAYNDANLTHTFVTAGDHLIRIRGSFPNIYFNDAGDKLKVKSVHNLGIVGWTRLNSAFHGCSNMTSFTAGTTDTSSVTNMTDMFYNCSSITALDLSSFNTSSVTDMSAMFRNCSGLTALDVSSFNTAAVTDTNNMFRGCSSLTALDVSNLNTAAATNIGAMFRDCSRLTALDVSNFNTTAVTGMSHMFNGCSSLTSLDVSNFNTAAVTNMNIMFQNCTSLTALDVSNFNTAAVTSMSELFKGCSSLTALDVSNFSTAAVTDMSKMFQNCTSLTDIIGVEDFNIEGLNSTGDLSNFMTTVTLPTVRYNALLINWNAQEPFDAMTPNFGSSTYTGGGTAAAARANLISNDGWTITDGGVA